MGGMCRPMPFASTLVVLLSLVAAAPAAAEGLQDALRLLPDREIHGVQGSEPAEVLGQSLKFEHRP